MNFLLNVVYSVTGTEDVGLTVSEFEMIDRVSRCVARRCVQLKVRKSGDG